MKGIAYFTAQIAVFCMPLSKNLIKSLKTLHRKKFRQKYNKFMAEGDKMVRELLQQQHYRIDKVYATAAWQQANQETLINTSTSCTIVNDAELRLISQLTTPNQVLATVEIPEPPKIINWGDNWSLYLDGLQDPGNVGTILRIADWFGIPRVIAGPGYRRVVQQQSAAGQHGGLPAGAVDGK